MWRTISFIHFNSISMESYCYLGCIDVNLENKKKKIIFRVMRHLSRIFMKEGATRVNFSIPLQLARWQTTLETPLGPFCISNDPVGSIVALMLLRKTFRIIGKKKCSSSGSSHFLANYQSSRTKGETMEEDKSILSKTNSTRNVATYYWSRPRFYDTTFLQLIDSALWKPDLILICSQSKTSVTIHRGWNSYWRGWWKCRKREIDLVKTTPSPSPISYTRRRKEICFNESLTINLWFIRVRYK